MILRHFAILRVQAVLFYPCCLWIFLRHAVRCAVPLLLGLEVALMGLQSLQYCAFLVVVAAVYLHLPVRMQPVFLLGA